MSVDSDSLWAKACVFFERAFLESKDDPLFGLWAALGLELLGRSAVSKISPTLLAEPDRDHKYLLHVLGLGSERNPKRTIAANQVFELCVILHERFSDEDKKICLALINKRNEELHTGASAFGEYPSSRWLSGFYRVCKLLCDCQGRCLEDLFGDEEAANAEEMLAEQKSEVESAVKSKMAAHKKVFDGKTEEEKNLAKTNAFRSARLLAMEGHHKVVCPSCGSDASVSGVPYGTEKVSHEEGHIIVRQPVSPRSFECFACGLRLGGYSELEVVGMGGRHSRTSRYSPEEYYGFSEDFPDPEQEYDND